MFPLITIKKPAIIFKLKCNFVLYIEIYIVAFSNSDDEWVFHSTGGKMLVQQVGIISFFPLQNAKCYSYLNLHELFISCNITESFFLLSSMIFISSLNLNPYMVLALTVALKA